VCDGATPGLTEAVNVPDRETRSWTGAHGRDVVMRAIAVSIATLLLMTVAVEAFTGNEWKLLYYNEKVLHVSGVWGGFRAATMVHVRDPDAQRIALSVVCAE
jgi:hypothetical protein